MWTKTIKTKFKGQSLDVQIWLQDTDSDGNEVVRVQSMINEYYLIEDTKFQNRDSAYDFIKHYPVSMANAFIIREGYSSGAIQG